MREEKVFMRDQILCRESDRHIGNVQNNLAVSVYKGKNVALFRAADTVIDCGNGTIIDFPSWKAMREMLNTKKPEVSITVSMLKVLAGEAEEDVAAGLAEEVKVEAAGNLAPVPAKRAPQAAVAPAQKKPKVAKAEVAGDPDAWLATELEDYPNAIHLVSSETGKVYESLVQEAATATLVGYDCQWSPDFDGNTDNPIALLQLAFPDSGNCYVLQLPMLKRGVPLKVRRLFESAAVTVVGFSANEIDIHKFEVSGIKIDKGSVLDMQPWCEAEMGENDSVMQGWRVGLKRAAWCVLDFEMDKTTVVASSNWERDELTTAQVEYAAMDVWVALRMYQRLHSVYRN